MIEHTYQLNVELQVHSSRSNPKDVEAKWHSLLNQLIEVGDDCATVSGIKCAKVHKPALEIEAHLARYLVNREKRTGQKWVVVERYNTDGSSWRDGGWNRALIKAEDGSTLRIYHHGSCWRAGQKVLAPKEQAC
jgi:hypothetical protein